jgi:hypothetical protein
MSEFSFDCVEVRALRYAAAPTLAFTVRIAELSRVPIHTIALRTQLRIEPQRRRYNEEESALLANLFGEPSRWGETLKPMQFATVSTLVPGFTGSVAVDVEVPCSYDLEVAAGKYFHSLREGVVPMVLLFSGTVFAKGGSGFWIEQVPWHAEASFRLPVEVWQQMMDLYFPNEAWIRLRRETVDALLKYKSANAVPTWDAAMERLLANPEEVKP